MKDNEIQKLVFCHPNFQTDFQRTANTSAPVLQHLMKMGVIKDKEKRELFGLAPHKRNCRIFDIIRNKKVFNLQPLTEALRKIPENEALLEVLHKKIERKKALKQPEPNADTRKQGNSELTKLKERINNELLPAAVGEDGARVMNTNHRAMNTTDPTESNLSTVIKHLKTKHDCLNGLCTIKSEASKQRLKQHYDSKAKHLEDQYKKKCAELERQLKEKSDQIEKMAEEREKLMRDFDSEVQSRVKDTLLNLSERAMSNRPHRLESVTNENEGEESDVDEDVPIMKHASSYNNIYNNCIFYTNENNTTGGITVNQQSIEE